MENAFKCVESVSFMNLTSYVLACKYVIEVAGDARRREWKKTFFMHYESVKLRSEIE